MLLKLNKKQLGCRLHALSKFYILNDVFSLIVSLVIWFRSDLKAIKHIYSCEYFFLNWHDYYEFSSGATLT